MYVCTDCPVSVLLARESACYVYGGLKLCLLQRGWLLSFQRVVGGPWGSIALFHIWCQWFYWCNWGCIWPHPPQAKLELDEEEEEDDEVGGGGGGEGEEQAPAPPTYHQTHQQEDAQQVLQNLIQTTELFDQKNSDYMVMEQKSEASRKASSQLYSL